VNLITEEQEHLLTVARVAIAKAIDLRPVVSDPPSWSGPGGERLHVAAGAFVSIHVGDDLRGCVGRPESDLPLIDVVRRCAVSAATSDSRFPALHSSEWPRVSIEISVLGPIEPVADLLEIEVGRHGLIAQLGPRRGLLLPQVATEWGWEREEFVRHTCRKAGLADDAWRTGAQLFKFEAQVFGDLSAC
jgi:uncharacterized protein